MLKCFSRYLLEKYKMSIHNILKRYLDFNSLYFKYLLRQTSRSFNVLLFKCLRIDRPQIFCSAPVLIKIGFPIRTRNQYWKWLLAIPLVYATYDRQSK